MISTTPVPQDKDWFPLRQWMARHEQHLARIAEGPIELLFLGDSITEAWLTEGRNAWDHHFAKYQVANFGIGGDETEHLLWRLGHGEIEQVFPQVIVLLIGTNNIGNSGQSAAQTVEGVRAVVELLQDQSPDSKIILHAVFPRDPRPGTLFRKQVAEINAAIKPLADGERVQWLDMTDAFLKPDGTLPAATMPDALHLSAAAYDTWAEVLSPRVEALLGR